MRTGHPPNRAPRLRQDGEHDQYRFSFIKAIAWVEAQALARRAAVDHFKDVTVPEEQFGFRLLHFDSRLANPEVDGSILLAQLEHDNVDETEHGLNQISNVVRHTGFKDSDVCKDNPGEYRDNDQNK
jgi:hypothetical protein